MFRKFRPRNLNGLVLTTLVSPLRVEQCSAALLQLLNQLLLLLLQLRRLLLLLGLGLHVCAAHGRGAAARHLQPAARLRQQRIGAVGGRRPGRRECAARCRPAMTTALVSLKLAQSAGPPMHWHVRAASTPTALHQGQITGKARLQTSQFKTDSAASRRVITHAVIPPCCLS